MKMAKIWNTDSTKHQGFIQSYKIYGATRAPSHDWGECKTVQPLLKTVWQLIKLNKVNGKMNYDISRQWNIIH